MAKLNNFQQSEMQIMLNMVVNRVDLRILVKNSIILSQFLPDKNNLKSRQTL